VSLASPSSSRPAFPPPLAEVAGRLRAAGCVFAEDEARLLLSAASTAGELDAAVARRAGGIPLEHVLGWAAFCGLRLAVEAGVFVPRRRTEHLVRRAAGAAAARGSRPVVVDLCCGAGAVGAALVAALDGAVEVYAVDIDPLAVRCARRNLAGTGARVYRGDLYAPLPSALRGRVDVLAVNAPYVPSGEIPLLPAEAREHEARPALDGGPDGLDVQRRVVADAPGWLAPGGVLMVETGAHQAARTAALMAGQGLAVRVDGSRELSATVVTGEREGEGR
jgi:release factor glutamine methyltransferase